MFNQNQEVIVDGARDVVLLLVEEDAFEGVNINLVGIGVLSAGNSIAKRKKTSRIVEVGTKDRTTVTEVIIRHNVTSILLTE